MPFFWPLNFGGRPNGYFGGQCHFKGNFAGHLNALSWATLVGISMVILVVILMVILVAIWTLGANLMVIFLAT